MVPIQQQVQSNKASEISSVPILFYFQQNNYLTLLYRAINPTRASHSSRYIEYIGYLESQSRR